jgi:hypothetical protein
MFPPTPERRHALADKARHTREPRLLVVASAWHFIAESSLSLEEQAEQLALTIAGNEERFGEAPLLQRFHLFLVRRLLRLDSP